MPTRRPSLSFLRFVAPVAAVGLIASGGCYMKEGPWYSGNAPLTYESTALRPKTVSLVDTRTQEVIWSVDIPADKQLVISFRDNVNEGEMMSSVMNWEIMPMGKMFGRLDNSIPAPPVNARRVDMSLRPSPELPTPSMSQAN